MRVPLPSQGESRKIVDATNRRVGFSIQNPLAVDVYYIIDQQGQEQRTLDNTGPGNVPQAGHLLQGGAAPPPIIVVPWFANGKVFARAIAAGGAVEVEVWDVDICHV